MGTILRSPPPGTTYEVGADLAVVECGECGTVHAIPAAWQRKASREGGHSWYCPRGHVISYSESEHARLLRRAEEADRRARAERDLREHTEHKLRAQKGATTKARKRHAAGVCPVCSRSFQQVRRHMESQHPDYDPAKGNE
jgi:hypothetical protein